MIWGVLKSRVIPLVTIGWLMLAATAWGQRPQPLTSRPNGKPGQPLSPFHVLKQGGAPNDGVEVGGSTCYRCAYGDRPMVLVFASKTNEQLTALLKQLNTAIEEDQTKLLGGVVTLIAKDQPAVEAMAKEFVPDQVSPRVPIVIPQPGDAGITFYGLSLKSDFTIITAFKGKVRTNYTGSLHEGAMKKVTADVAKLQELATQEVEEAKSRSGLPAGKGGGAFMVYKIAGAPEDGIPEGKVLSYNCKYMGGPSVKVFARKVDEPLVNLIRELNDAVAKGTKKEVHAFVCLLGPDREKLDQTAKELAKSSEASQIPICVAAEHEKGPPAYLLNPEVEVTVLVNGWESKVASNHVSAVADINESFIKSVLSSLNKQPQRPANVIMTGYNP
jgi:hypothetical protein